MSCLQGWSTFLNTQDSSVNMCEHAKTFFFFHSKSEKQQHAKIVHRMTCDEDTEDMDEDVAGDTSDDSDAIDDE